MNTVQTKNQLRSYGKWAVVWGSLLTSLSAFAGFDVMQSEEQHQDYGNAQNQSFQKAVAFEDTVDAQDRNFLQSVEEKRVGHRSYLRMMLARPNARLKDIESRTSGIAGNPQPVVQSVKDDVYQVDFAWGYKWTRWAAEMELLFSESLDYNSNPVLAGEAVQLKSSVQPIVLFFNLEYEIPTFFEFVPTRLHPYASVGPGLVLKTVDNRTLSTTGQGRKNKTHRSLDFAWEFSLGLRYQITNAFLVDVAYRWLQLGSVDFGPIDTQGYKLKSSDFDTRGFYMGFKYQM